MFYFALFIASLYFKIARVQKKEERLSSAVLVQYFIVGVAIVSLLVYGFMYEKSVVFLPLLVLFTVMASLMITAIQLGIFVNGKPLLGLTRIYRYLPVLGFLVVFMISCLWFGQIR